MEPITWLILIAVAVTVIDEFATSGRGHLYTSGGVKGSVKNAWSAARGSVKPAASDGVKPAASDGVKRHPVRRVGRVLVAAVVGAVAGVKRARSEYPERRAAVIARRKARRTKRAQRRTTTTARPAPAPDTTPAPGDDPVTAPAPAPTPPAADGSKHPLDLEPGDWFRRPGDDGTTIEGQITGRTEGEDGSLVYDFRTRDGQVGKVTCSPDEANQLRREAGRPEITKESTGGTMGPNGEAAGAVTYVRGWDAVNGSPVWEITATNLDQLAAAAQAIEETAWGTRTGQDAINAVRAAAAAVRHAQELVGVQTAVAHAEHDAAIEALAQARSSAGQHYVGPQ